MPITKPTRRTQNLSKPISLFDQVVFLCKKLMILIIHVLPLPAVLMQKQPFLYEIQKTNYKKLNAFY